MLQAIFCFSLTLGLASALPWISVPLSKTSWVPVLEVEKGRRFLLHPKADIVNVSFTRGCSRFLPSTIEVRFWDVTTLGLVRTALKKLGACDGDLQCRVEPYQSRYLRVRDQFRVWKPLRSTRYIPRTLPATIRLSLIRVKNLTCAAPGPQDLKGLVFDLSGNAGRYSTESIVLEANVSGLMRPVIAVNKSSEKEVALQREVNKLKAQLAMKDKGQFSNFKCPNETRRTEKNLSIISDCLDVKLCNLNEGYYFIWVVGRRVFCYASGEMLVFKRTKIDRTFEKGWSDYARGMGRPEGKNYFIGLTALSFLTGGGGTCMTIVVIPKNESVPTRKGQYSNFKIGLEKSGFQLFYDNFSGTFTKDPFRYHKKRYFTTYDRQKSLSVGCAKTYKGGFWYIACFEINLFGTVGASSLAFSSKGLSAESPNKHFDLQAAYMTLRTVSGDPQALTTIFTQFTPTCPTRVQEWFVPETAVYVITAGGASGGRTPHVTSPVGGRGSLVRTRVFLEAGSKLRFVVGCGGDVGTFSGAGGDGTFVVDRTRKRLLIVAGGGGGAGWKTGGDGQSSPQGGKANLSPMRPLTADKVRMVRAKGWRSLQSKMLRGPSNETASTGGATFSDANPDASSGGGGGGGYEGGLSAYEGGFSGEREEPNHSAGGGGSSFCDDSDTTGCSMIEGGNLRSHGFVQLEVFRCFQDSA